MKRFLTVCFLLLLGIVLSACSAQPATTVPVPSSPAESATSLPPTASPTAAAPTPAPATATPESSAVGDPTALSTPTQQPAEATATPTPAEQPTTAASSTSTGDAGACINKAGFFGDVSVPDNTPFSQGEGFVKTWKVRNEGTCTWGSGYALVFAYGEQMSAPPLNPMPAAAPGDIVQVSVKMTSPNRDGIFTGNWQFQDAQGNRFGVNSGGLDYIWVMISVGTKMDAPPTPTPVPGTCAAAPNPDYVSQLLTLINQARADNGLPALTLNGPLSAAAQVHSRDMACNSLLSHIGSDGSRWDDRIGRQGYGAAYASENIYAGSPQFGGDPSGAMTWWLNSQVHRDNILSKKVTEIGIGYAFLSSSEYGGYYTLNFARPK